MKEQFKLYDTTAFEAMGVHTMLRQFHTHFGIGYDGPKRVLSTAEMAFRLECHAEEAQEYVDATTLPDMLDALADEVYFLAGTAHRMGLRMNQLQFVGDKVEYSGAPRFLPTPLLHLRLQQHTAAIQRIERLASRGAHPDAFYQALALAIHAFTFTALLHGFNLDEAIRRVHAANMAKNVDPEKQRRRALLKPQGHDVEHMMEITKPDDWLAPYLGDLAGDGPFVAAPPTGAAAMILDGNEVFVDTASICGLITIDGPDASGKTTLAKRICEVTGGQYIHLTWSPQLAKVMHLYRMSAIGFARALAQHCVVVLERPWLSHPVYDEIYRAGLYELDEVLEWKHATEGAAALNLLALPSDKEAWLQNYAAMCEEREELHGPNLERAGKVYGLFWHFFTATDDPLCPRNAQVYDMHHVSTLDIDLYIANHVLPHLKAKEIL